MAEKARIYPSGTARRAFLKRSPIESAAPGLEDFLERMRKGMRFFNLDEEIVQLAAEVALRQKGLSGKEQEAAIFLAGISLLVLFGGSTRLPVASSEGRDFIDFCAARILGEGSEEIVREMLGLLDSGRLDALVGGEGDFRPLIYSNPNLYMQRMFVLERSVVEKLRALLTRDSGACRARKNALSQNAADESGMLSEEQQNAVNAASSGAFTVIAGGPGTGKTSVIASILKALISSGAAPESIALAAPTGKAANRMEESLRKSFYSSAGASEDSAASAFGRIGRPRTLHRLLGYSPSKDLFTQNENNRLPETTVVVDESSMIDLSLMERLLAALRDDARLVLIGDSDQLPSVEAGTVFRDLLSDAPGSSEKDVLSGAVVRLTRNFRMRRDDPSGAALLEASRKVREGDASGLFGLMPVLRTAGELGGSGIGLVEAKAAGLNDFLEYACREILEALPDFEDLIEREYRLGPEGFEAGDCEALGRIFEHYESRRLLCLTRGYYFGTESINDWFHRRFSSMSAHAPAYGLSVGEPLMMQKNDYSRNLFNGDQGLILKVSDSSGRYRPMVVFRRGEGFAAFHPESIGGGLKHSFAVTVHKSQGSEFDHAALILPDRDMPVATREALYTALTRCRKSFVFVGERDILAKGIERKVARFSGIGERLRRGG